jgi:hypothetical protein
MSFKKLIDKFGISEKYTRPVTKQKEFNRVKNNMIPIENTNFMADLLFLAKTKKGFQYLLVVCDLADDDFDIEPLKTKVPNEVKNAWLKILKRKYLKKPVTIVTDGGTEFKGDFHGEMKKEGVYHKTALANNHRQLCNVESLNRQLGRLFNGYMNKKEEETGKQYKEWTDIVNDVRTELNEHRHKKIEKVPIADIPVVFYDDDPKYKVGDMVHYKLMRPKDALGHDQNTTNFREGDYRWSTDSKPIQSVFYMRDKPWFRYQLKGLPQVSFYESELMTSDATEETQNVRQIIDKRKAKGRLEYLVWFKGDLKAKAVWLPRKQLLEDGIGPYIKEYEQSLL